MATVFKLKLRQATVAGVPLVINLDDVSLPNELQLNCVSGDPIQIEGNTGTILGLPVTPMLLYPTQSFNFNEQQYENVVMTIPVGTTYELIANE
jgi:hypothetical protein